MLKHQLLLMDPTLAEEAVCDGSITIVVDAANMQVTKMNDNDDGCITWMNGPILSFQKLGGGVSINLDSFELCTQLAFGRVKELQPLLQSLSPLQDGLVKE